MKNPEADFGPVSAEDRWVDALLTEHARLGRDGEDEELVYRILANTVHSRTQPSLVGRPAAGKNRWAGLGTAAAIAALVSLLLVALVSLPGGRKTPVESGEMRFVVRILEPASEAAPAPETKSIPGRSTPVPAIAAATLSREIPALARIELFDPATISGTEFALAPSLRTEDLKIRADRYRRQESDLVYEGKVLVEHKDFRIEADRVKLRAPGTPADSSEAPLLAEKVRVLQADTECVAEAARLEYDPVTASLRLTGITRMSTARGELARFDPAERVVLSRTGFSIESGPLEVHSSVPLKQR